MECIYVFGCKSPLTGWYIILPSNKCDDIDIYEIKLEEQFAQFSQTEVELWRKFTCDHSVAICERFYFGLTRDLISTKRNWVRMTLPKIKERLIEAGLAVKK